MKTEDGFIIEASTSELYKIYINEEYFRQMSFCKFLNAVLAQGTIITDWEGNGCENYNDKESQT